MSKKEEQQFALGVCKLLPIDARRKLVSAAASRRVSDIDEAVTYARSNYPQFYQQGVKRNG